VIEKREFPAHNFPRVGGSIYTDGPRHCPSQGKNPSEKEMIMTMTMIIIIMTIIIITTAENIDDKNIT